MEKRQIWKTVGRVALWIALLVLPSLVRTGYYYRGWYGTLAVNKPNYVVQDSPTAAQETFVESDVPRVEGTVVIDLAHNNAVREVELNVLLARLTARGVKNVIVGPKSDLTAALHQALALIVVAPHRAYTQDEIAAVERFVEQGGRVLLVGDPGRYAWITRYDELGYEYYDVQSDVATLNSLAAPFGLTYSDDYVYNTVKNDGHYQYVIVENPGEHRLVAGIKRVVLYAAHSLAAAQEVLVGGDENTISSLSEQAGRLTLIGLGGDGKVLALPDLTFMTEPYNSTADNNRLIANIADFLVGAERTFGLTDFPYFFNAEVGIVPLVDAQNPRAISAQEIGRLGQLKATFEASGRVGKLWADEQDRDVLYIGLYGSVEFWPQVAEILAAEGITFTLDTVRQARATPTSTPRWTPTPTPTRPAHAPTWTPTPTPTPLTDWIHFAGGGPVEAKEVALFYQNEQGDRQVMIVLAFTETGLRDAADRLIQRNWKDCLIHEDRYGDPTQAGIVLCPVGYDAGQFQPTVTPTPSQIKATPTVDLDGTPVGARLLIVSDEDGKGVYEYWTEAYTFSNYAEEMGYEVTLWSTAYDGELTLDMLQEYDAVIWCTGDYQNGDMTPEDDDLDMLIDYLVQGGRLVLSGAFLGDPEEADAGLLVDVQITQSEHPLVAGFSADQVIALERFTADEDYKAFALEEEENSGQVMMVRGPKSELAGRPLMIVDQEDNGKGRFLLIGVPLYLMPSEPQEQLARNILTWLTED